MGGTTTEYYARSGTTLCAALLVGRRLTVANVGDSGCLRISRQPSPGAGRSRLDVPSSDVGVEVVRRRFGGGTVETGVQVRGAVIGRLIVERLSRDHKPECDDELERIQAAGGVVFPLPNTSIGSGYMGRRAQAGSPGLRLGQVRACRNEGIVRDFGAKVPRVWRADGRGPGLAMSRSIGDKVLWLPAFMFEFLFHL